MIEDTIARIEERLRTAQSLRPEQRSELERLLAELRREAEALPPHCRASRSDESDVVLDARGAADRLGENLTEFEASHPQLVALVNRISTILSNMGI
jgi:hypothetical protein